MSPGSSLSSHRSRCLLCLVLIGCLAVVAGCGSTPEPSTTASGESTVKSAFSSLEVPIEDLVRQLGQVRTAYRDAVSGGSVRSEDDYQKALLYVEGARDAWTELKSSLEDRVPPRQLEQLDSGIQSLHAVIQDNGPVREGDRLVRLLQSNLRTIRTHTIPPERRGVVRSVRQADRDIQAETEAGGVRVGAALVPPTPLYRGSDTVAPARGASHQLRVWVRQRRTKQSLPGSSITARIKDEAGTLLRQVNLLETWGPYEFYGQNLELPGEARNLEIQVGPATVGRHGDTKDLLTGTTTVTFPIKHETDTVIVEGDEPTPIPDDYTLGSDVEMALGEARAFNTVGVYKVGFIAEHSEPFWQYDPKTGSFNLADIPRNANRHLEIVLFTASTNRPVPHGNVSLSLRDPAEGHHVETSLPFLLSVFYHYGNSVYLPAGTYEIQATVRRPAIHTLRPGPFPSHVSTSFEWDAQPVDSEAESGHE